MKRKALLVAESPDWGPIPGVYSDVSEWELFLRSPQGGCWSESEIVKVVDGNRRALVDAVGSLVSSDYSLILFSGHGETIQGKLPWPETRLFLCGDDTITERELNPGCDRCAIILDVCRSREEPSFLTLFEKKASWESELDPVKCRALYTQHLEKSEKGLVTVYSTGVGEAADDIYPFSKFLVRDATEWTKHNSGVLSLRDAVELAAKSVTERLPQQKPEYHGGRRLRHFPFAVHA